MNFYWIKNVINSLYFYLAYFIKINYEKPPTIPKKISILKNWFQKNPENAIRAF
jgi:hypothetical protein